MTKIGDRVSHLHSVQVHNLKSVKQLTDAPGFFCRLRMVSSAISSHCIAFAVASCGRTSKSPIPLPKYHIHHHASHNFPRAVKANCCDLIMNSRCQHARAQFVPEHKIRVLTDGNAARLVVHRAARAPLIVMGLKASRVFAVSGMPVPLSWAFDNLCLVCTGVLSVPQTPWMPMLQNDNRPRRRAFS